MLRVNVKFLLRKDEYPKTLEIEEGKTLNDLMSKLGIKAQNEYFILVNGYNKFGDYVLRDGDNIKFFPAMSGG